MFTHSDKKTKVVPVVREKTQRDSDAPGSFVSPQNAMQLQSKIGNSAVLNLLHENRTGMPDSMNRGIESLSGMAMDDVRVHYNSAKPAQQQALAYAQGSDIHVATGQEQHIPHEAWHAVQQQQGRVRPTKRTEGQLEVNDDPSLEQEADDISRKAKGF